MKIFKFIVGFIYAQIETTIHKIKVLLNIVMLINVLNPPNKWKLYWRGLTHDISKYRWSETFYISKIIFTLRKIAYASKEYNENLAFLQPAIKKHYQRNSHHPEHYENGFDDMTELDKLELIADWEAASHRHSAGDVFKSIEINQYRFGYDDTEKQKLINMAEILV